MYIGQVKLSFICSGTQVANTSCKMSFLRGIKVKKKSEIRLKSGNLHPCVFLEHNLFLVTPEPKLEKSQVIHVLSCIMIACSYSIPSRPCKCVGGHLSVNQNISRNTSR